MRYQPLSESRTRRDLEKWSVGYKQLSRRVNLEEEAFLGDGITVSWDTERVIDPGTSILLVEGYRYVRKNDETVALGIWDYEENEQGFTTRHALPAGTPAVCLYAKRG